MSDAPTPHPRPGKPATIYTVADLAGVSHQTVSRYLKGETLRPANAARVEQALVALDYRVNDVARALATNRSERIGAFIFDVDDWAPSRALGGAAAAAREAGYILDIVRVDPNDAASIDHAIDLMNRTTLAGVVVLSPSDAVLERLDPTRLQVPWFVESEADHTAGGAGALAHPSARAVEHLVSLGHERFFHVGGPTTWLSARNRLAAYRAVVHHHGLRDCGATAGEWNAAAGYAAMASYPLDAAPTAIVAASDQLALGALHWLREHGVAAPGDVCITGFDGLLDAAFYAPPLTTVAIDFAQVGRLAVRSLLARAGLGESPGPGDEPAAELVVRASTGAPGRGVRTT